MSQLFTHTRRETPSGADPAGHALLLRAGFVRQVATGIFDLLPLGVRVRHKLETILRSEMAALGVQEVSLPLVQPAELWRASGRWESIGEDMARLKDRAGRELCLAMTHEEVATALAGYVLRSYKQLPVAVYQIQTKFRDEPRPRGGLIRTREFTMKDAYSFHADEASLAAFYQQMHKAYLRIFARCGLDVVAVESDQGVMGGSGAHEYMVLTPIGEDTLLLCSHCDYRANRQVATFQKPAAAAEEMRPLESIATPDTPTIQALATLLGVPKARTAKAVFVMAERDGGEVLVFAVVRGDMELSETKLGNTLGARRMRPASLDEVRAIGAEPGYGSPIGIRRDGVVKVVVVVDTAVAESPNLVAGANRVGYHLVNSNHGRDYHADVVTDIAAATDGDACPRCGAAMRAKRGVEVGNIFRLGARYSRALGATFVDETGHAKPLIMGSYGIGVGRVLACIAETHRDDAGLVWPASVAPYDISLVALGTARSAEARSVDVRTVADTLYQRLTTAGFAPLYDDRDDSAGVKFNDADLIGLPLRVTVGSKGLAEGTVEVKVRRTGEVSRVAPEGLEHMLQDITLYSGSQK